MTLKFARSFTQQAPLPDEAVEGAQKVLQSARLHRYQAEEDGSCQTALLEAEFAKWQGAKYCLAVASGGQAIQLALRASGVTHGDPVLSNAFTLAPVPGAIRAVGGQPVLIETCENLTIDLNDLAKKAARTKARYLLLSHMRGHLPDMDALMEIAQKHGLIVIEDCAHTMGASWKGRKSGNFGAYGCFSTQTYKHMNSGEGGLLTTNDPKGAARAIIISGSYMNYPRHGAAPALEHFEDARFDCPNMSARMDNLRAAILRPQLQTLDAAVAAWDERMAILAGGLKSLEPFVLMPEAVSGAKRVHSSIQFRIPSLDAAGCQALEENLGQRGVEVKWFGHDEPRGFTSRHSHWRYLPKENLPRTDRILGTLFDMRLPLSFSPRDCEALRDILCDVLRGLAKDQAR